VGSVSITFVISALPGLDDCVAVGGKQEAHFAGDLTLLVSDVADDGLPVVALDEAIEDEVSGVLLNFCLLSSASFFI